jgi:hypothetical protein
MATSNDFQPRAKGVQMNRCFACDRILGETPKLVDTRDGQTVYVGVECFKLVKAAGKKGYQPPQGGPVLWLLEEKRLTRRQVLSLEAVDRARGVK